MPVRFPAWPLAVISLMACGTEPQQGAPPDADASPQAQPPKDASPEAAAPEPDAGVVSPPLELHLVFLHGVGDDDRYLRSDEDLVDFEKAVRERVEDRRAAYEASSSRSLVVTSARFNLYTDLAGNLASPGTDEGSGDEVASRWRSRLAEKLANAFPNGEKNIILLGHSTGARAAMEVAADVGAGNVLGAGKWGFIDRIAGVVSVHGMIDALGGYETTGSVIPFSLGCKVAKPSGWCAYAADISAIPAADWVATHRHTLMLTSIDKDGVCGTPLWNEPSDQTLPVRAQGNPASFGLDIVVDGDSVFRPAHGVPYGKFCHSDITNTGSPRHADAVDSASSRVVTWLFDEAPRVVNVSRESQTYDTPVLQGLTSSQPFVFSFTCPAGSESLGPLAVVGNCHHPGHMDGDDHAMTTEQLVSSSDAHCGGTVTWNNIHDHPHSGTIWFKSYARGSGVIATLP